MAVTVFGIQVASHSVYLYSSAIPLLAMAFQAVDIQRDGSENARRST